MTQCLSRIHGIFVPKGPDENSPAFQRQDQGNHQTSPAGTTEIMRPMSRSQLRQERDCASEASRSNGGIETSEGDFYAWCGDKLSPLRSGWGQLVPTSPAGTAESGLSNSLFFSRPCGTCSTMALVPALKRRAILIRSLRD